MVAVGMGWRKQIQERGVEGGLRSRMTSGYNQHHWVGGITIHGGVIHRREEASCGSRGGQVPNPVSEPLRTSKKRYQWNARGRVQGL